MSYVTGDDQSAESCPFCLKHDRISDTPGLIVKSGELAYVTLNLYPYNNGHLMILPYRHIGDLTKLRTEEANELMTLLTESQAALEATLAPEGFNIGMNIGEAAGAGIPAHLHFHIVPRWAGDTNFMPVIGDTKVLPETLKQTKERLLSSWEPTVGGQG